MVGTKPGTAAQIPPSRFLSPDEPSPGLLFAATGLRAPALAWVVQGNFGPKHALDVWTAHRELLVKTGVSEANCPTFPF